MSFQSIPEFFSLLSITFPSNRFFSLKSPLKKKTYLRHFISFFCRDKLQEVVQLLRNTTNPQVEYVTRTMKKWARDNQVDIQS